MVSIETEKYYKKKNKTLDIFKHFQKRFRWLKIDYGQILLFNQSLPHGNIINKRKRDKMVNEL